MSFFRFRHDVFHHDGSQVEDRLRAIGDDLKLILANQATILSRINQMEKNMSKELDDLTGAVGALETAVDTHVSEVADLTAQLAAAKNDPAAIEAIAQRINTSATKLTGAVAPVTAATDAATTAATTA